MAALLYQFTAPRRKVLGGVWRSAICIGLAISSMMAAAMTWAPLPAASACAGASISTAACQNAFTSFGASANTIDKSDLAPAHHIMQHAQAAVHITKKTTVSHPAGSGGSGSGSGGGAPATGGLPCKQSYMFVPNISMWTVPPGCYANIYYPDRTIYHANSTFGFCNWWVEALHPNQPDILWGSEYTRTSTPIAGAAVWFNPYVQGASSAGHWAQAVAVSPDGYWVLITEMNFGWRGGGFGRVDFRYIHAGPGVVFIH
jgi:hypothetical protein